MNTYLDFVDSLANTFSEVFLLDVFSKSISCIKSEDSFLLNSGEFTYTDFGNMCTEKGYLNHIDLHRFSSFFSNDNFKQRCLNRGNGLLLNFRRYHGNSYTWHEAILIIPSNFPDETKQVYIGCMRLSNSSELIMESQLFVENRLYSLLKMNFEDDTIDSYNRPMDDAQSEKANYGTSLSTWKKYILNYLVYYKDKALIDTYLDAEFLKDYFSKGAPDLCIYYRRKVGNIYKWVKGVIMPSTTYSDDCISYIFMVTNINSEALAYISHVAKFQFQELVASKDDVDSSLFERDLHLVMKSFTEPYQYFASVDLIHDIYITYKEPNFFAEPALKSVGIYSEILERHLGKISSEMNFSLIRKLASIENIQKELADKSNFSFTYLSSDGKKLTCHVSKIASMGDIPSKVLICALEENEDHHLLKVKTFGLFEVYDKKGNPVHFEKKQSKQVLAYLIDKKGYPISIKDIVTDILEKSYSDLNAQKYASALIRKAIKDLEAAGYSNVIIEDSHRYYINKKAVDCDYYHLLNGNAHYWRDYDNDYMREFSWAEETNAEISRFYEE